jgi:alanyl-tRNA synthetase
MLGNWSLGDYFKQEQLPWVFEFLVDVVGLDPKNLYVTVFSGNDKLGLPRDNESVELWKILFASKDIQAEAVDNSEADGMQNGRIFYYDEQKNWWSRSGIPQRMPVGEPGGPDSEIFWDFGADLKMHENSEFKDLACHVNCDCGRFFEIANNVFMQYKKVEAGFEPLPKQNVDFGGGLERIAAASLNNPDVFNLDLFEKAMATVQELSGKAYDESDEVMHAYRVILDHLRGSMFLISDGAVPSNKDQGYFTRRLIRRAIRFAHKLGIEGNFCGSIIQSYIDIYKQAYPELADKQAVILESVKNEEAKFQKTLVNGLREFEKLTNQAAITGEQAFILFSTYGFPLEIIQELAAEKGLEVDVSEFNLKMKEHKDLSRKGAEQKFAGGLADHGEDSTKLHTATHLLHQALKNVLGEEVEQKGSNITAERLRFDFNFDRKMTDEEKKAVEDMVNEQINKGMDISFEELDIEEARKNGAIGLFEDKYGNKVKVYKMGDFSYEICGGPHVKNTKDLGSFKIKKEQASSAGVRRIKAIVE